MCLYPKTMIVKGEEVKVSCGRCILCRRKKCRTWAIKLYNESLYHSKMCMITLTFSNEFLLRPRLKELKKFKTITNKETKQKEIKTIKYKTMISPYYTQDVKKTGWLITLFMKKLRKELDKYNIKFSYFAVGEHGDKKKRAHWHIIFFGIDNKILNGVNIGNSGKNKTIYYSKLIEKCWNYDKMNIGIHTISDVNSKTIKYVANYTMKKMYKNEKEKYPTIMRFSNQSKIGIKYARKYHKNLRNNYITDGDNIKYTIPKTYLNEMERYAYKKHNKEMDKTADIIRTNKDNLINKLLKSGILKMENLRKKAKRLEIQQKMQKRDIE